MSDRYKSGVVVMDQLGKGLKIATASTTVEEETGSVLEKLVAVC